MKSNVVLFDNDDREHAEYMQGIISGSKTGWKAKVCIANGQQRNIADKLIRYGKYFVFPFSVFLKRKQYNVIVGWQAFYAINFAFYCRLFKVKKENKVVIQHLIYRPKNGFLGSIYEKYMKYAVNNQYVDIVQTEAEGYIEYIHTSLGVPKNKIKYVPFGVNDFSNWPEADKTIEEKDFVLAIGRSNRDWEYVIEVFKNTNIPLVIICDSLSNNIESDNIKIIHKNGLDTLPYFKNCLCSIIAVKDGNVSSGDTVLCQCLAFGKSTIVVSPCSLEKNYLIDGFNGYIVERNGNTIIDVVKKITDTKEYERLSNNCRKDFNEKYSLFIHASHIGELTKELL